MSRLLRVELRRVASRRLTGVVVLAALVVSGLMIFGMAQSSKPLSGAEQRQATAQFQRAQQDWMKHGKQQVASCLADQAQERKTDPGADLGCHSMQPRRAEFDKPAPRAAQLLPQALEGTGALLGFLGFLLGASLVAAEFATGAIGNWLTFEPRRGRVYASKIAGAAAGMLPIAVVVTAITSAGAWVIADTWGSTALTSAQTGALIWSGVRVVALGVIGAAIGAAFGALLRHTAAVIGVAFGYLILVEGVFRGSLQHLQQWMVTVNVRAWIDHGATYFVQRCQSDPQGGYGCTGHEVPLSFTHGAVYLLVALIVLVGAAAVWFRRRDVT